MESSILSNKKYIWIAVLVQNVLVSIESLFFAIVTFKVWGYAGGFSIMHFMWLFFTLVYIAHAIFGIFMKDKPLFILAYAVVNATCRFLFFSYMLGMIYLNMNPEYILRHMGISSFYFAYTLYLYYLSHAGSFYFWFWIQLPLMAEGTVLVLYYRNLILKQQNNNLAINIGIESPLYQQTPTVPNQQYYQPSQVYTQPAQVYNPNAQVCGNQPNAPNNIIYH